MNTDKIEADFQLLATSIIDLQISNSFIIYDERKEGKKTIDVSYNIAKTSLVEEKNKLVGLLDLKIVLLSEVDEQKFALSMVLRGAFEANPEIGNSNFANMLKLNGCAALYSIARANISSISTQMFTIGNIVLPMVNFIKFNEIQNSEQE